MKSKLTFQVKKSANRQYYWHVAHRNGNVLLSSETYTQKAKAVQSMKSFIKNMVAGDYDVIPT